MEVYPVEVDRPVSLFHFDNQLFVDQAFDATELLSGKVPLLVTDSIGTKVVVTVEYDEGVWKGTAFHALWNEKHGWRSILYNPQQD